METDQTARRSSSTQILQELEALSESMYQSYTSTTARRTASLSLPRTAIPPISAIGDKDGPTATPKTRPRRMSLSPWRSRPKLDNEENDQTGNNKAASVSKEAKIRWADEPAASSEKKSIWNWKPIRALKQLSMQKLSCLFSVEVVTVQGLPASMNGLRLSVCVRKKENRDGAVQTMPSRASQGAADFEETLFLRCNVYYTPGSGTRMTFEPRPFLIYVLAVDAEELDFGRRSVDLSGLIQESIEKSSEGARVRQWDMSYDLSGKAKGGELVLKLGFQIMEDGGVGIYNQPEVQKTGKIRSFSPSFARKQSKSSFSVPSPRLSSRAAVLTPSQQGAASDLQGIDDLNLDEPAPPPSLQKPEEPETKMADDNDLPDFDVVDKGVEILDKDVEEGDEAEENSEKGSVASEVVKEVVQDQSHMTRLTELDSIAQQIKALESMMGEEKEIKTDEETASQMLDAEEDKVTREFLQMLEDAEGDKLNINDDEIPPLKLEGYESAEETESVFLPDLGKGLGCIVQTRNGGFLAATNPLDTVVARKDTPKLAMQMSKPLVLQSNKTGFELFQKMAAIGLEELTSEIFSLMPMDELMGKTAEQIAFEGIASAIIQGRNKEGASSTAARTVTTIKSMGTEMSTGRKERISSGIWNVSEEPVTVDEILAFSMQKIESMAVNALKIQAGTAAEDAPFDVSPLDAKTITPSGKVYNHILASATPVEDWIKATNTKGSSYDGPDSEAITMSVVVQLRDPIRQYEAVGGPMLALVHATCVADESSDNNYSEEKRYKVASLQVGGIKVRSSGRKNAWDGEKQRLTALQWLVAYGIAKAGKRGSRQTTKGPDLLWSTSSRVMADMWLKPIRNPDVKFTK
ncbi:protein PLASTID MOVEMENT IMPAIRED 1 [Sesamum alatum]|uniref:Protein PLASTID MOVEMENT IMPAIRED 1 n=1 Tax=Sesamum alatum TaxID=300844 RepID=A0AAE1YQ40_9LAMI|nr:protein PLASTID MOVEMENT IMPAIRED 1 [Sesamum alatum]